jgi:hypothetical protein
MAPLYRIVWSDPEGTSGNGEYCLELEGAISWLSYLRNKYPTMIHSIESQPQPSSLNASALEWRPLVG